MSSSPSSVQMEEKTIRDPRAVPLKRALISVTDKTDLADFAAALAKQGVEILSTGGTAKMLREVGIDIRDVSDATGFPEIMDGRVKTLHPSIHGGILARRDKDTHLQAMTDHGIGPIDLVVINLYPFTSVVADGRDFETCIENIDIGGPALIRAAVKNHEFVAVVTDPQDYDKILTEMETHDGATTYALRRRLAANAVSLTATYDSNIAGWFAGQVDEHEFPRRISVSGNWQQTLRYGENPHQQAALYLHGGTRPGAATATQVQGKELSYNNLHDADAAFELVASFEDPAAVIVKHANPSGVAVAGTVAEAYQKALHCDPVSAFGGIIALNKTLDVDAAAEIVKLFTEVIIAPSVENDALEILKAKENIRVLTTGDMPDPAAFRRQIRNLAGGFLIQDADNHFITQDDLEVVTEREPTAQEMEDMLFAFTVAKRVTSNAIVYAKNKATVGIGAGQMSRLDSARIAAWKARDAAEKAGLDKPLTAGSVVASDAFFPFPDGLLTTAEAGATAVIQPGGSVRDADVIAAADERGLAMVFTGVRHFRH